MSKSAIGDLAGITGRPLARPAPPPKSKASLRAERTISPQSHIVEFQPRLLNNTNEQSDRITVNLPTSLLTQVDGRIAVPRRKKKVSVSGYIEAALRELLATGGHDVEALERHRISARRSVTKVA